MRCSRPGCVHPAGGFSIVELQVVVGIVAVLLGLLLPVLAGARARARSSACLANLRSLGLALVHYADDNGGYVPRDGTTWLAHRVPWPVALEPYLDDPGEVRFCPALPDRSRVPAGYVMNAFRMESAPDWDADGPIRLSAVRRPSAVVAMTDVASELRTLPLPHVPAEDFVSTLLDVWHPEHLPGGIDPRIADGRHDEENNVLWYDTSASPRPWQGLKLTDFDDGIRTRTDGGIFPQLQSPAPSPPPPGDN